MDYNELVDGVLEYVPPIAYVQSKFEPFHALEWLRNYTFVSVIASAVYVPEATIIFIFPLPQVSFFLSFFLSTSPITSCK